MAKTITNQFHPDVVPPPGDTIIESLEAIGMKQSELARRMGVSEKYVIDLLAGDAPITAETALKLERVLNVPRRFWTNLELRFREHLATTREAEALKASIAWAKKFPLQQAAGWGWIKSDRDWLTTTHRLLTFFGCASEEQWDDVWGQADVAFRHSPRQKSNWHAVTMWLRRGQMEAQDSNLPEYNPTAWEAALDKIRANISPKPSVFQELMKSECNKAGVGLIFLPSPSGMAVSGACKWLNQNPQIYLSLRYKTDDHLWFSFFHEAMHVRQNIRKRLFVDEPGDATSDPKEIEADKYAAEILIPRSAYDELVANGRFDPSRICSFASEQKLTPGVVVGRLQHDRHIPWASSLNRLKVHYEWAAE